MPAPALPPTLATGRRDSDAHDWGLYAFLAVWLAFPFAYGYFAMRLGWIEGTWRQFLFDLPLDHFGLRGYIVVALSTASSALVIAVTVVLAPVVVAVQAVRALLGYETAEPQPNTTGESTCCR